MSENKHTVDLWGDRYMGQDDETIARHLEEDSQLLRHLGMELVGAGPGLIIATPDGGTIQANTPAWEWLRALLVGLAAHTPHPDTPDS